MTRVVRNCVVDFSFLCGMNVMVRLSTLCAALLLSALAAMAQDSTRPAVQIDSMEVDVPEVRREGYDFMAAYDTLGFKERRRERKERRKARNFQFSILGGPSYSPDFGFLLGGSALMTFRTDKSDLDLKRSVMPFSIALTMGGAAVGSRPQIFFAGDRFRIFGTFSYKYNKDNYYGVGYHTNHHAVRGEETTLFTASYLQINPQFLFRIKESDFFVGPAVDFTLDKMLKPSAGVARDAAYLAGGGTADGYTNISSGLGIIANYDSRDLPANAYKGVYLEVRGTVYNKWIGSDTDFYRAEIDYRQYVSVGKRKVLAWTAQSKNVFGDVPVTRMPLTGSPYDLRGYYMGQYRDKTSHVVVAEYRQMFNSDREDFWGRLVRRLGWNVWAGCGFVGDSPVHLNGVLPNAGLGLRIEIQPRMNIRLDFGRNFVDKQNLFYFNMTEAF